MNKPFIQCKNLTKTFHDGNTIIEVLKNIDFDIQAGSRIAIVGPSGSGKSTLLHLLGGLDKPTQGLISIKQKNWQSLNEKARCQIRNKHLGFIYQFHHLLPEFSALENVAMPLLLAKKSIEFARHQANDILCEVGLANRITHKPAQLSGGERQRIAIARALIHKPDCVLADEPTGNLDQHTANHVFDLMTEINKKINTAIVIVTHDLALAKKMDIIYRLQNSQLIEL